MRFLRRVIVPTGLIAIGIAIGAALARMPVRDPGAISAMKSRSPMRPGTGSALLNQIFFNSLTWYACALSVPLFLWIARRYPISRQRWRTPVAVHLVALVLMVLLTATAYYLLNAPGGPSPVPLLIFARSRLVSDTVPFLAIIAAVHAFEYRRRERVREAEAVQLSAQLAQSRLEALTAQLHPHFLFNTLQGISTLMHRDVSAADAMLSQLSDLLRRALLRSDQRHEIPLGEELEMLEAYVAICRQRFGDRLVFETRIEPSLHTAMVPFFLLQPLVENALEHGIARRVGVGHVTVGAAVDGDSLELRVTDDGGEPIGSVPAEEGIGLSNTRSRLRALYRDNWALSLRTLDDGRTEARVTLPLHRETAIGEA